MRDCKCEWMLMKIWRNERGAGGGLYTCPIPVMLFYGTFAYNIQIFIAMYDTSGNDGWGNIIVQLSKSFLDLMYCRHNDNDNFLSLDKKFLHLYVCEKL